MFRSGPNYTKLKTNLRLTINRLKLLEKKKTELAQKARKEIADYIANGKEDRARIRVEHIVREDYMVEAMEMLEMYCDLLLARFGLLQTQKELDPGLEEPIASILWASPRLQADIIEFKTVADQFNLKYGKEFVHACHANSLGNVNEKLMHKLGVQAPPRVLIERYLMEIAKTYNVPFEPDPTIMNSEEGLTSDGMLIDFGMDRKNKGGGGGGGLAPMEPAKTGPINPNAAPPFAYPARASAPYPAPPLPTIPPAGAVHPLPGPAPIGFNIPPAPHYNEIYDNQANNAAATNLPPAKAAPNMVDTLPNLPAVPSNSLPPVGGTSAGGEDVDFDDLTRRFEDLKKKK